MTNISVMPIYYEWKFAESEEGEVGIYNDIAINEVFDILPLNGNLEPGEIENVEFIFNSYQDKIFRALAICQVEGGPFYEVELMGNSSSMQY